MSTVTALVLCSALLCAKDSVPYTEHVDPKAAGMDAARLASIPILMQEFVEARTTAGVVTLVARHGRVASFEAVGYQDLEKKLPMRKDTMYRSG
jgi:CubicO group peptidase (beta-lactamase class C family)